MNDAIKRKEETGEDLVASMSLGGGYSYALNRAVELAIEKGGVHFSLAAGNSAEDSCNYSPPSVLTAVTVGAMQVDDQMANFSNSGPCMNVFAPGVDVLSTWIGSDTATNVISGTSMAAPHVAGLMAYFLSLQPKKGDNDYKGETTPADMLKFLMDTATKDTIKNVPDDTPNLLVYNQVA